VDKNRLAQQLPEDVPGNVQGGKLKINGMALGKIIC